MTRRCQWCVITCAPVFQNWSKGLTSHYQDWTFYVIYLFFHFTKYFSDLNAPWKKTTTSITGKFPVTFYFSLSLPLGCGDDFFEFIPGKKIRYISLTIYQSIYGSTLKSINFISTNKFHTGGKNQNDRCLKTIIAFKTYINISLIIIKLSPPELLIIIWALIPRNNFTISKYLHQNSLLCAKFFFPEIILPYLPKLWPPKILSPDLSSSKLCPPGCLCKALSPDMISPDLQGGFFNCSAQI